LKKSTSVDVNVTPYFTISGENISISGNTLSASFTVNQVVASATLEKVYLVLSKTQFADEVNNIFRSDITGNVSAGAVNVSADLSGNSNVAGAQFLYGRVGVKTVGTEQAVWSPVVKLK
jgi:type II secretory pathway component PulK